VGGSDKLTKFFKGYMFDMKVYNVSRSVATITETVKSSGCAHSNVNCTYCPLDGGYMNGKCLATCDIGTWVDKSTTPDTCTA
jgi:hypothetical protein